MGLHNDKIKIKKLELQDLTAFQDLLNLFQKVFDEKQASTKSSYLKRLLNKKDFIVFCVFSENKVVGGLTAYELPMYDGEYSEVFIYDFTIKPEFQRQGLGKQLLLSLENYCKQKNIHNIFVSAHQEDKHALDFYEATGGNPVKVVHFDYSFEK